MNPSSYRLRLGLGRALVILLGVHFAVAMLPMPTFGLWMVRLVARETWLAATVLGVLALLLAPRSWMRGGALAAALFGLRGLIGAWPMFGVVQSSFSPLEYVRGGSAPEAAVQRDVVLEPSRPDLTLDLYTGAGDGPRPLVVVIHGGSWQRGDKGEVVHVSRALAAAGWSVADVRYRLAPAHRFPAPVADLKCLLGRLRGEAARLRLDPARVVLLGRSAGGHLALLTAYSLATADKQRALPPACAVPEHPVQGVISIYPLADLEYAYAYPPKPDLLDAHDTLQKLIGGPPEQLGALYKTASPTTWAGPGLKLPPTLLVHGQDDMLVPIVHSTRMYEALRAGQHTVRLLGIPGADHGFDFRSGGIGEQLERAAVLHFLRGL